MHTQELMVQLSRGLKLTWLIWARTEHKKPLTVRTGVPTLAIKTSQTSNQMITLTLGTFSRIKITHSNLEIPTNPTSIVLVIVQRMRKLTKNAGQLAIDA